MKQTLLRSCCRESSTPILNWLVTCHWWRAHSWERRRKIWIPRLSFTQGHILPKMPLGCLSNCISQEFWNQLKRKWLSPSQDFCYSPFLKNSWFFFSVKTAHSYLMPRVLSKLRDQHSSNYTMSWHTAHAALEPNGSILPLAEISTGEEGREGSRTCSAKAIGARGFWARLCSCSGQYSSCDHSEAQGQVQSGEGRAPLSSSSHRELQAKSKDRVATRLVLGTTDHHSHGLPPQW